VEKLWMNRAYPVDGPTPEIFFARALWKNRRRAPRRCAFARRFACMQRRSAYNSGPFPSTSFFCDIVTHDLHRFQESIAGRSYLIEVAPVARDRWRAHIVRLPGMPNALMPFYGRTPDEAARQLSEWLTRAHQRAGGPGGTV
jgi:hypothetical protein